MKVPSSYLLVGKRNGWRYRRNANTLPKSGYTCKDCAFDCPRKDRPKDGICAKFVPLVQTTPEADYYPAEPDDYTGARNDDD